MMYYQPNLGYIFGSNKYNKDRFRNPETLNIFCDGSFIRNRFYNIGGFSSIGVVDQNIIDVKYNGWTSVEKFSGNIMELYALKDAISMAFIYRNQYSNINIFSDSNYAVDSVKSYIFKWTYDPEECSYMKNRKEYASNVEIIYEVAMNFINLMCMVNNLNLYFVKGHINNFGSIEEIKVATEKFRRLNHIKDRVDYNLIRYLSKHNDIADHFAKIGAKEVKYNCNMDCPIQFIPQDINSYAQSKLVYNSDFDNNGKNQKKNKI